jgi:hypothetical protein
MKIGHNFSFASDSTTQLGQADGAKPIIPNPDKT